MKIKKITLIRIAEAARVAPSTVSRALHDDPRISDATKEKIRFISKEMGYTPPVLPNGEDAKGRRIIGLLTNDLSAFYSNLYNAIQQAAEEMGYWILQACTDDDDERARHLAESMIDSGVAGIIFGSCKLVDPLVEGLIDNGPPVVLVNRRMKVDRCDSIRIDSSYGAYLLINHLINIGYRRIAIITASLRYSVCADRHSAFLRAMEEKELPVDRRLIRQGQYFSRETGYRQTRKLMLSESPPEAIFCCDEKLALGCMMALKEMNLRVPEDVAVASFDDADTELMSYLRLTTVSYSVREMGRLAAKAMIERIEGILSDPSIVVLEPKLVIRQSCGLYLRTSRFHPGAILRGGQMPDKSRNSK
jgi:DNA-binding LacI/PurR family transcriptional regulator